MKYDDASWHYGADNFSASLPQEAGATHTGMFVAWAFLAGLAGPLHIEDFPEDIPKLQKRIVTPGAYFYETCDGKFTDEDLNDIGNQFAQHYYDTANGQYLKDYEATLGQEVEELYAVADTWENYDRLSPVIEQRFREWSAKHG